MDGLLDRHRPTFHPRRQTCSIAERPARKFQGLLKPRLLGGRERSAQSLAKRGGSSCQVQRLLGVRLRSGTYGETFEGPRDAAFVTQLLEQLDAFAVQTARLSVVPLIAAETCQIGESARNSPAITQSAKLRQALFTICTRGNQVSFFPGDDVAQIV